MENDGGMILTGKSRRTRRKTCPRAIFSTINPTWIDPDANPGLRGERPGTNRPSHGMAVFLLDPKVLSKFYASFKLSLLLFSIVKIGLQQFS
jgi:hypothetical protein